MSNPTMNVRHLEFDHEGHTYQHVLLEDAWPEAAVVIVPNYMGVQPGSLDLASEFVRPGVEVLILDVYGRDRRPNSTDTAAALSEHARSDPSRLTASVQAALASYLAERSFGIGRVSVVGFCFGGAVALELARTGLGLNGVVALHADLSTRFAPAAIGHRSKVLTVQGAADPLVPPEQILAFHQEMNAQAVEWELILLGGLYHAFTDPGANAPGVAKYDERGRHLSFERARAFLA